MKHFQKHHPEKSLFDKICVLIQQTLKTTIIKVCFHLIMIRLYRIFLSWSSEKDISSSPNNSCTSLVLGAKNILSSEVGTLTVISILTSLSNGIIGRFPRSRRYSFAWVQVSAWQNHRFSDTGTGSLIASFDSFTFVKTLLDRACIFSLLKLIMVSNYTRTF